MKAKFSRFIFGTLLVLAGFQTCAKPNNLYLPEQSNQNNITNIEPIYVGGARYELLNYFFEPIHATRYEKYGSEGKYRLVKYIVGYEMTIPVDGDFGQELIFDVSGYASKDAKLSVSCGSFSGSDFGTRYYITKRISTGGSCKTMKVRLDGPEQYGFGMTISILNQLSF
ncbi:hypothetical protein [Pseudoalteromonas sp. OANN1]|uniref:hypothetical protein n=1 Tax=Pseudoalteromonas sp. OANN1 TaxID=2954497 RepID=UPI002097FE37|nr:hypothetical protein [Pseudoalteromonas sp. OANN1]MCO7199688.1 hypothetical protein [Pseudoalteromonas sp. OANN1]